MAEPATRSTRDRKSAGSPAGSRAAVRAGSNVPWLALWIIAFVASAFFLRAARLLFISGDHFRERIVEVAGPSLERRQITARIIDDISAQVQRFLLVRLVTAVVVALATWGVLAWIGVPQAAVWGILAGVFNSIPYFGPIIVSADCSSLDWSRAAG